MKRRIKLTEQDVRNIVKNSVKRIINEAESEGWVVEIEDIDRAMQLGIEYFGEDEFNKMIVRALGYSEALAHAIAYVFRMNDVREWDG
jgi:hypothetical protein